MPNWMAVHGPSGRHHIVRDAQHYGIALADAKRHLRAPAHELLVYVIQDGESTEDAAWRVRRLAAERQRQGDRVPGEQKVKHRAGEGPGRKWDVT